MGTVVLLKLGRMSPAKPAASISSVQSLRVLLVDVFIGDLVFMLNLELLHMHTEEVYAFHMRLLRVSSLIRRTNDMLNVLIVDLA